MIDFKTVVKNAMLKDRTTVFRLHKLTGISTATLYQWLSGKHRLPDDKLAKILAALEINIVL